jgi:FkbM family methyltransferase
MTNSPHARPGALATLRIILSQAWGIARVSGPRTATRWLWKIATNLRACRATGNLQPADLAMGDGPIPARLRGARASLVGVQAISGLRELWVRDLYLGGGYLAIRDGDVVVDLGANMGNFTLLALGHGPRVRVFAVEASKALADKWRRSVEHNGWQDRARLTNAFIGATTAEQERLRHLPECAGVPALSEDAFVASLGVDRIDFLKCDIEGSEYSLLKPGSRLLAMTRQIAIEVHADAGDVEGFRRMLHGQGFEVVTSLRHPSADVVMARRP